MSSLEIVQCCKASGFRILDWLEDGESSLVVETVAHIIDDLELLEERLADQPAAA